jgi:hypothetical protein
MASFAGAVILPDLKKTLLFKNRDLISQNHRDEIFYDRNCFGIHGINRATGIQEGLTIGVNYLGLAIANTLVRNTPDSSYHILTEELLMSGKDAEDCLGITVEKIKSGKSYQWSNLILADNDSMLVIELAGGDHSIEWSERRALRTSHHIMLDTEPILRDEGIDYDSAVQRVERGYDLVRKVSEVQDVFELLKDHGEGVGNSSICRHPVQTDQSSTIMSYLIEINNDAGTERPEIIFHFAKGNPCKTTYSTLPIVFPADNDVVKKFTGVYHGTS